MSTPFYKNKHVIIALIVAPILAIISYFAVDMLVSEKPHAARAGVQYSLAEKSNCRYSSGRCTLKNGEFELLLSLSDNPTGQQLTLTASHPLSGVLLGKTDSEPSAMKPLDDKGLEWSITLPALALGTDRLQIAASSQQSIYYGDASTEFVRYETSFQKDFRPTE